jgi:lactoylglutathione lyase
MTEHVHFDHVGITVADLDRAVEWYGGALDLVVEFVFELPQFGFRGVMLKSPTGYRIELLERAGSAAGPCPSDPIDAAGTQGFGHMCLDVADVDASFERLRAGGAAERMSPRPSPEPGVRMAYLADPEGNLIELLDRRAAAGRPVPSTVEVHVPVTPAR